jgi:hypothetical protein
MKIDKEMRDQFFEVVENQIKSNSPPATKLTYNRLSQLGYNDFQIKQMIGQCVSVEIFEVVKSGQPFNEKRYVANLNNLPKEPFD